MTLCQKARELCSRKLVYSSQMTCTGRKIMVRECNFITYETGVQLNMDNYINRNCSQQTLHSSGVKIYPKTIYLLDLLLSYEEVYCHCFHYTREEEAYEIEKHYNPLVWIRLSLWIYVEWYWNIQNSSVATSLNYPLKLSLLRWGPPRSPAPQWVSVGAQRTFCYQTSNSPTCLMCSSMQSHLWWTLSISWQGSYFLGYI